MNTVNFIQLLCKKASENGEDIQGIFDTLVCEKGKNVFNISIYYSQMLAEESYDEYYYRIILRYLGKDKSESKHFRVDSGIIFNNDDQTEAGMNHKSFSKHRTTHAGRSGRLSINYGFDVEMSGNYEVDLYVKRLQDDEDYDSCERLYVKDLDLVSIAPFQVILQSN